MEPEHAQKWRLRAVELRERADWTRDETARATLLGLAAQWDAKADRALSTRPPPPPKELRER